MEIARGTPMHASVLVATRNRPERCARCLSSVLAALPPRCEIVCVDQSDGASTRRLVPAAPGLRYVRSARRGVCAARNDAARLAAADILLITDDDCMVPRGWVEAWLDALARMPAVDIGFGPVRALTPERRDGFTPEFLVPVTSTHGLDAFRRGPDATGLGANMAIRRDAWERIGGFDEALGAGSRYPGAEETDIAYRVVRSGSRLLHQAGPTVIHDGFRARADAALLSMRYSAGAGAMYMKHIRCADRRATEDALLTSLRMVAAPVAGLATGRRPLGLRSLWAYVGASVSSLRLDVDRHHRRYRHPRPTHAADRITVGHPWREAARRSGGPG